MFKKILLFLLPFVLAVAVFFVIVFVLNKDSNKGALQVTANPKSKIYLNDKMIGETPMCRCSGNDMLTPGQYSLKLVSESGDFSPYEEKVTVNPSVLTVLDRNFGEGGLSDSKTITLTKLDDKNASELMVISFPEGVSVFMDGNLLGTTPLTNSNLTESDHELRLSKNGYRDKSIRIRGVIGYKLTMVASLGILPDLLSSQSATLEASSSAQVSTQPQITKVVILDTPTGFLRVRSEGSLAGSEIGKVSPGETYELIDEMTNWYEIKLSDGKLGWISSQYAKKQ